MAEKRYWLDEPRNVRKLIWLLCAVCALLLASDLVYHKHAVFDWEEWIGFYAFFGYVAGTTVVLGAKELRRIVHRDEDYYER